MNDDTPAPAQATFRTGPIALLLAVVLLTFVILEFVSRPYNNYVWYRLMDWGHIPLFGFLAVVTLIVIRDLFPNRGTWLEHYALAATVATILGALSELRQYFGLRNADMEDLGRDVIGVVSFLLIYSLIDKCKDLPWSNNILAKLVILLTALGLFIYGSMPLIFTTYNYVIRENILPAIF
ncbi:MAG: VanZ family protein [Gammaproteobacteria bacterium]